MKISVVIPVFRDTAALDELIARLHSMSVQREYDVEIVFVDDGSPDDCWQELKDLKKVHSGMAITLIRLSRNHGQHQATLCGLMHSHAELIVTMDADLQHPPEEIPKLLGMLVEQELDLVYGASSSGHSGIKRISSQIFRRLTSPIGAPPTRASAFRAMRKALAERLIQECNRSVVLIDPLLQSMSPRVGMADVIHLPRKNGRSSYTPAKIMLLGAKAIFNDKAFGRTFVLAGLALLLCWGIVLTDSCLGIAEAGWPGSSCGLELLLSGAISLGAGILSRARRSKEGLRAEMMLSGKPE
ncbi:MAG: hypothetical protein K0R03_95 [Moraxellaceae bacterium]|jgi:glycosyltransferase involved in cell wall biosynthesis|nr:hypothetical protein [Moraxellaceae bacterium]